MDPLEVLCGCVYSGGWWVWSDQNQSKQRWSFPKTCVGRDQRRAAHASSTRLYACLWSESGGCGQSGGGEEMCGKKGVLETVGRTKWREEESKRVCGREKERENCGHSLQGWQPVFVQWLGG